jgi:23S rRNA-/tRNA-specific pseudouridylate synthase
LAEAQRIPLDIKHETPDYLVLWKPAGVLSHPSSLRDLQTPSVVAFVYHQYRDLPSQ